MLSAMENRPITKEEIDRLAAKIEEGRKELNRISSNCRMLHGDLGQMSSDIVAMSQVLDEKIITFMKMEQLLPILGAVRIRPGRLNDGACPAAAT